MRRTLAVFTIFLCIVTLFSMTGCTDGLFGTSFGAKKIPIVVFVGETQHNYTVACGQIAEISVPSTKKDGYYLTGYWSAQTGGTKYFEVDGKSCVDWDNSNPTTFYAQYKSIADMKVNWNWGSDTADFQRVAYRTMVLSDIEKVNAILANRQHNIIFTISFKIKRPSSFYGGVGPDTETKYTLHLRDGADSSAESYAVKNISIYGEEYTSFEFQLQCSASVFSYINGKLEATLCFENAPVLCPSYLKNLRISAEFAE